MLSFSVGVDHVPRDFRNYITDVLAYKAGDSRMKPSATALNAIVTTAWGAIHNSETFRGKSFEVVKRTLCEGPGGDVHTRLAGSKVQGAFWAFYDNILSKMKDASGSNTGACEMMGWTSDMNAVFGSQRQKYQTRSESANVDRIAQVQVMWSMMSSLGSIGVAIRMAVAHPPQRKLRRRGDSVEATPIDALFSLALYGSIPQE